MLKLAALIEKLIIVLKRYNLLCNYFFHYVFILDNNNNLVPVHPLWFQQDGTSSHLENIKFNIPE